MKVCFVIYQTVFGLLLLFKVSEYSVCVSGLVFGFFYMENKVSK